MDFRIYIKVKHIIIFDKIYDNNMGRDEICCCKFLILSV